MIRYRLEMPQAVRHLIRHLPPELKTKVKVALRSIAENPERGKELREELAGLRSYRIGRSRIVYRVAGSIIEIVAFGPRVDIYARAAVELAKKLRGHKDG